MLTAWGRTLSQLVAGAIALAAIGWWLGQVPLALLVGALAYLCWHLFNLYRLDRWSADPGASEPPSTGGVWGELIERIAGVQRKRRKQKKRMAKLLVEYREFTEAMPDAVVMLGKGDRITWYNESAIRLLGLAPELDIGHRLDNLLRAPVLRQYLREGDYGQSITMTSPVNDEMVLSVRIIPYGKRQRWLLAHDITERAELERMRKDFVANASHELRTPLTVLSGYLEGMTDDHDFAAKWNAPLGEMNRQARRMENLVEDLLDLSRLETEKAQAVSEPVVVSRIIRAARSEGMALSPSGPAITQRVDSYVCLLGDEEALKSVCQNLVANAVQFTPASGHVEIGWRTDESGGYLWVRDDGPGIEPEHLSRLTERFYRVDPARSRERGGTGLGLAIVKHALERHEARLVVESEPGAGSLFTCVFPTSRLEAVRTF